MRFATFERELFGLLRAVVEVEVFLLADLELPVRPRPADPFDADFFEELVRDDVEELFPATVRPVPDLVLDEPVVDRFPLDDPLPLLLLADDFDLDEADARPSPGDRVFVAPAREPELDDFRALPDRPPVEPPRPDPDDLGRAAGVTTLAAAPTAPTAAPAAAPLNISPATSITLSTTTEPEVLRERDELLFEDLELFREPLVLDLLAIISLPV